MRRSKRIAFQVHLWLGVAIGLLWSLQGLTGATLVFHRELDRWAHPEWRGGSGPPLPVDRLIAIAEARTERPLTAVGILDSGRDIRTATYADGHGVQRMLLMDAATGATVGERQPQPKAPSNGSTSRFIYMIHEKLISGPTGETIIGISGCLLLSSSLLGLWLAWPRRGNWRALVSLRGWRTLPQKLHSWHRVAGLVFGVVFVFVAIGGIYMTFTDSIRRALATVVSLEAPYKSAAVTDGDTVVSAQAALDQAQKLFPGAAFVRLALPDTDKPFFVVRLRQPGETRAWSGATIVTIDAPTGKVVQVQDGMRGPLAERVLNAQFSIHNGEAGGIAGRLLILAAGLSLPTFYVTGLWLWLRNRRLTQARRRAST